LEYDDVMNHQRKVIYERRQKMLAADKDEIENMLKQVSVGHENAGKVIEEKRKKLGDAQFAETARRIGLYTTDTLWMEHLEAMDYLRSSVNLRAYGQREPIVEYKKDGLMMFREMEEAFKEQVFSLISTINTESAISIEAEPGEPEEALTVSHKEPKEFSDLSAQAGKNLVAGRVGEVGRNDPCPCGAINPVTGEIYKYKKCGLINAPQHRKSLVN
jgi:preprotein translocase subunit SecA